MPKAADKLAYALSSCDSTTRQQYKRLFDRIYLADAATLGFQLDDVARIRRETGRNLEALGLCDFTYGEEDAIYPCEPHFAVLPRAGLPAAVLTGARTPASVARIRALARTRRATVVLAASPQPEFPLLPSRILIQAATLDDLRDFATAAGVRLLDLPAAGVLLGHASDIGGYVESRTWRAHREEPTWKRDDFAVATLQFRGTLDAAVALRLSQYTHPRFAHRREHVLIRGGTAAIVDRDWGKFAALAAAGLSVLRYDAARALLFVPVATPLPRILARAVVACSGFAPQMTNHPDAGLGRLFVRVPHEYATMLAAKVSQTLTAISFPHPIRGAHD
jgi:hypothetical protein